MTYQITNQRDLRRAFWQEMDEVMRQPGNRMNITRRRIINYAGNGKMHNTNTRCAWCDWMNSLSKDGAISQELAQRATLD